jgi:hypothetical protein
MNYFSSSVQSLANHESGDCGEEMLMENKDNRCFMRAVLSCLYPADKDPQRITKYEQY